MTDDQPAASQTTTPSHDFKPGDHRTTEFLERRSVLPRIFLGLIVAAAIAGGSIYWLRPDWAAPVDQILQTFRTPVTADLGRPAPADAARTESRFVGLYQRYRISPLASDIENGAKLSALLATLQKEPCDSRAAFQASLALEERHEMRGAADLLSGFADNCPESSGERYRASELYYLLGDYDKAIKLSTDLIDHQPDAQRPYFVRARSEQALKRYAAAIDDYTTLIRLLPDTKSVVSEVFTRMSDSYEKLDRPCEAIGPIQTYIALDSEKRSTQPLLRRIAALAAKGNCTQAYATGTARIPRRSNGVSTAKVQINGITGTFIVDTGASFVTLTRSFADRAKPQMFRTEPVEMQTANGTTSANLATVDSVKLAGVSASSVPTIIASKSIGDGVDGLLGMSFLSRFTVVISDREIQLKAKTLNE
ncbi:MULTISPECIES: TIGR02281 family clan AA aspartic protease [unclassified Bradyrhizobium]|uniref:TIGR02281 family clan AA aspartic protease n=1 Tax=unclassified Bradyrhizobium TaxID=2631580 RepID=UPI0024E05881|nr:MULTISPECIES: TIGR02281 family clan AA aspartic protease [unclassified Bradyrhizobium]